MGFLRLRYPRMYYRIVMGFLRLRDPNIYALENFDDIHREGGCSKHLALWRFRLEVYSSMLLILGIRAFFF